MGGRHAAAVSLALSAAAALALATAEGRAQGARVTGVSTARYVELRPWADDSVPIGITIDSGSLRRTTDGLIVRCVPGEAFCRYRRRGAGTISALPLTQDLTVTAWGFGTGVSLYANVRARAALGDEPDFWPRSDDHFDALAAYLEVDRERFRARAGRQWATTGLGFYNFDGVSLAVRPLDGLTLDAYGGWSLARGLNEPRTSEEIRAVDQFAPRKRANIVGAQARYRPSSRVALGAQYQREIRTDRAGLHSERVAADAVLRLGRAGVDGALEHDLATGDLNEARLRLRLPPLSRIASTVEVRRYRPFFELWTIWGVFSPVGFDEASTTVAWGTFDQRVLLDAYAGLRRYHDPEVSGDPSRELRDDGWRVGGNASWRASRAWTLYGGYGAEIGFGASRTDQDIGVRWEPGERLFLGARASAFQSIFEFRVGEGRVLGLGLDGGLRVAREVRLVGDITLYRHDAVDATRTPDWSQRRASLRLEWTAGADPGEAGKGGRGGRGRTAP